MEPFILQKKQFLQLEKWQQLSTGLVAGFTTKNGGVSKGDFSSFNCGLHVNDVEEDVLDNREALAHLTGFPLEKWVVGEQVHHDKIHLVSFSDKGSGARTTTNAITGVDGLITKEKGIQLTAFFADCIPLFYFDPIEEIIGIAHGGWKGTVKGIAKKMVTEFEKHGSKLENILVSIGPGISRDYYEVDNRVVSQISGNFRETVLVATENERYLLDLKELNREILLQYGILRHNIDMTAYCTYRDKALFYSHRRDQGKTGRMLGFIGMRE